MTVVRVSSDGDYRITSIYQIEGEEIYPISHLIWGPGLIFYIFPIQFVVAFVLYAFIEIMKNRKKKAAQSEVE